MMISNISSRFQGRAGQKGHAVTLIVERDAHALRGIVEVFWGSSDGKGLPKAINSLWVHRFSNNLWKKTIGKWWVFTVV